MYSTKGIYRAGGGGGRYKGGKRISDYINETHCEVLIYDSTPASPKAAMTAYNVQRATLSAVLKCTFHYIKLSK